MSNPWSQMPSNARRRVAKTKFDLFWVVDESGQFAFSVLSNHKEKEDELKIRGINTKIRKFGEKTEVFVVINSNEEWRILEKICNDLTQVANEEVMEESALVTAVWQRLKRWKRFFGEQTAKSQTELYAQLLFIQLAAQAVGFERLLRAWEPRLRPNFYFEKSKVLVRACDARGYNLLNAMGNELAGELSLCAFILRANKGKTTLLYQAEQVAQRLQNEELKALFARKLESVKVVLGVKDEYTSFEVIDFNTFSVKEGFARIVVNDSRIEGFGYTTNLNKCDEFKFDFDNLLEIIQRRGDE